MPLLKGPILLKAGGSPIGIQVAEVGEMGTRTMKSIMAGIWGQLYSCVDTDGTHCFKKSLKTNGAQKDNTFYLASRNWNSEYSG